MWDGEILCEGVHDRAFLKGWLMSRGWRSAGGPGRPKPVHRRTDKLVHAGSFLMQRDPVADLVIKPTGGWPALLGELDAVVGKTATRLPAPMDGIVAIVDLDRDCDSPSEAELVARRSEIEKRAEAANPTRVDAIVWYASGVDGAGVPRTQTLERLVCAALAQAYPLRAEAVQRWLDSRPERPADEDAKAYAWSYMAGWAAKAGPDRFLESLFSDALVKVRLDGFMEACGAAGVLQAIESR